MPLNDLMLLAVKSTREIWAQLVFRATDMKYTQDQNWPAFFTAIAFVSRYPR